jgi:hypothetical protein
MFVFLSFLGRYLRRDEVISLRVWGLMPRLGTPLACPDVPRGVTPKHTPNPMILGIEPIIPHQRANTRDPSIENPWRGEGSYQWIKGESPYREKTLKYSNYI